MAASSIGTLIPLNFPYSKVKLKAQAVLTNGNKMRVPYELKQGQTRLFHKLPSGLKMEVIFQKKGFFSDPAKELEEPHKPPIVFVHGSFHAGWCWAEHWLPFFSRHGFNCYALSLLGQGGWEIKKKNDKYDSWKKTQLPTQGKEESVVSTIPPSAQEEFFSTRLMILFINMEPLFILVPRVLVV